MNRPFLSSGSLTRKIAACLGTILVLLPLLGTSTAAAQTDTPDEVVIFVLDLSGSMNESFDAGSTKLDAAKAAFVEAFANVRPEALVGLRTYGDQIEPTSPAEREPSCTSDTRLVTPVAPLQREQLISQVQSFNALGDTPMGLALQAASTDIPAGSTGTIVLFSDGRDECFDADLDGDPGVGPSFGQDPCEIARSITAGDAAVDRVVTVGFRADAAAETELRCIAESTGGTYTSIATPEDARDVLPELLVQLSAPREAQRLVGRSIEGTTSTDTAPDFVRLDAIGTDKVLYTDSIDMGSRRIYRMAEYGPPGGTFTATVFGLPPQLGIELDMWIFVPRLDDRFFQGEQGDFDAGIPARPSASIRCTDCQISGGPHEAFFVVSLETEDTELEGTYELEILTEGPGFGGPTTSCSAPQACFYPQEIIDRSAELEAIQVELNAGVGELASQASIAERDRLIDETAGTQAAISAADARSTELEARILLAPGKANSYTLPLLLIMLGLVLAFAPVHRLKRKPKDEQDPDTDEDAATSEETTPEPMLPSATTPPGPPTAEPSAPGPPAAPTGPSLEDVGPAPAISPTRKGTGIDWKAELEAAKIAMAGQLPVHPETGQPEPAPPAASPPEPAPPTAAPPTAAPPEGDQTMLGGFTAAQHAAARAAAEQIALQRAAEAAAAQPVAAVQPAAVQPAAPEQIEALRGATAAEEAATQAAAEQAATRAAAEQAARDAARSSARREAAEQAERDQAAAEQAERDQAAAERAAAEEAARQAAAEREAAEKAAAERAAAEKAAAEEAARIAAEKAATEEAARIAAEKEAAEEAARQAAEKAAAEKAAAEKAAAEKAAADKAAAEKAAAEEAALEAAAEKAAAEAAAAAEAVATAEAPAESTSATSTEEERRQEARLRMLAKQNIVASSSSSETTTSAPTTKSSAGTAAALRAVTTPPAAAPASTPAASAAPDTPGWYEDPAIVGQFRWWDGSNWTGFTTTDDQAADPS